jgi:hypothetical protein
VSEIEKLERSPSEKLLREHLAGGRLRAGIDSGHWRIASELDWPHLVIAVSAASRDSGPGEFALRFDLDNYPTRAPTATPWDIETNTQLAAAKRPKGHRVGMAFRADWEGGRALYVPYDRVALESHQAWLTQYPRYVWDTTKNIAFYLRNVHELLNDDDYQGV